jgi:thioredoxin reductase (NADPH)
MENVVILGSGPAGLTCSIYLSRAGISHVIISGKNPGGQLVNASFVENYPGFESISGADLMEKMFSQASSLGATIKYDDVVFIEKNGNAFDLFLSSDEKLVSRSILIATGVKHRHLGCDGEDDFIGKGVSYCATCDGAFYKNSDVIVVGGGNTAVMDALFLSNICRNVCLIHRRDKLRADLIMQNNLFQKKNVKFMWDSEILEISGDKKVKSVRVKNIKSNELCDVNTSAVFVAIGADPLSDLVEGLVSIDTEKYIITDGCKTSCSGIFAAGDVVAGNVKQAVVASGNGCVASKAIESYLTEVVE